jgi:DNA repair exonuclease SbcCD ATPase subunit
MCDGNELNPSGGVVIFNGLVEQIFGINKYSYQLIINGTNLLSFGTMSVTQRKNLMNKAMGIDIYDKIHKLATDDYRYTNKLITSLNNTKEFVIQTYGSYENLCTQLNYKKNEVTLLEQNMDNTKSRLHNLRGTIDVIRQQNPTQELNEVNQSLVAYKNVVETIGTFDTGTYDRLVQQQIDLNTQLSNTRNERSLILRDLDELYRKREDIQSTMASSKRIYDDYREMVSTRDNLINQIDSIQVEEFTAAPSSHFRTMISQGQSINSLCKDIKVCLNDKLLNMLAEMVVNNTDISAFLVQVGAALMDYEKEKSAISRVRDTISSVQGEIYENCPHGDCLYMRTYEVLQKYFKSYQSANGTDLSQYDIEQFEHAHKCVQMIRRMCDMEVANELKNMFTLENIMVRVRSGEYGIDIERITFLMEEAAKIERKEQLMKQLEDIKKSIANAESLLLPTGDMDETINCINAKVSELQENEAALSQKIRELEMSLAENEHQRSMVSQVKNINVAELSKRSAKLQELANTLSDSEAEYNGLYSQYNEGMTKLNIYKNDLKRLEDAYNQYNSTVVEVEKHLSSNKRYNIIAEATSSTKGKPVVAIREKVEDALYLTNRLLDVMYDKEIQMLKPTIDETSFSLPFRCGSNVSSDIRYGSQSESTLLSLALSLSLASSLTPYNIPLIDEMDAALDAEMRDSFLMMLQEIMSVLKMEQMFIISHSTQPGQYDHTVHVVNISEEVAHIISGE